MNNEEIADTMEERLSEAEANQAEAVEERQAEERQKAMQRPSGSTTTSKGMAVPISKRDAPDRYGEARTRIV